MSPALDRCPACRRRVVEPACDCPRCGADLELLGKVYGDARSAQTRARRKLALGDVRGAIDDARVAVRAVNDVSTRATLVAALAARRWSTSDATRATTSSDALAPDERE